MECSRSNVASPQACRHRNSVGLIRVWGKRVRLSELQKRLVGITGWPTIRAQLQERTCSQFYSDWRTLRNALRQLAKREPNVIARDQMRAAGGEASWCRMPTSSTCAAEPRSLK